MKDLKNRGEEAFYPLLRMTVKDIASTMAAAGSDTLTADSLIRSASDYHRIEEDLLLWPVFT